MSGNFILFVQQKQLVWSPDAVAVWSIQCDCVCGRIRGGTTPFGTVMPGASSESGVRSDVAGATAAALPTAALPNFERVASLSPGQDVVVVADAAASRKPSLAVAVAGMKHVVKVGKAKTTVRLCELKQQSTEPYDGHEDNQGGFQTGQYLWDSGLYLARWALDQRDRLRGCRVIELGSGLGLPGLVAAKFADHTMLTDCAADIVANLNASIDVNGLRNTPPPATCSSTAAVGTTAHDDSVAAAAEPSEPRCSAAELDWNQVVAGANRSREIREETVDNSVGKSSMIAAASSSSGGGRGFDVVLASDCIYMVDMAPLVAGVVAALLGPSGFAALVFPEGRPGVPEFLELMRGCECSVLCIHCTTALLLE